MSGFFTFAASLASANNDWMLRQIALPPQKYDAALGVIPYGMSAMTLFIFLFFTPTGLLAVYLAASGAVRGIAASVDQDDARGDFVLSAVHHIVTTGVEQMRAARARRARERDEGVDLPDVLVTGAAAGIAADLVVIAARRKPEWNAGAIIMTGADWYKLGPSVETRINGRLRTLYPLTKMDAVEVVRRGIMYELPPLSRRSAQNPQNART